MKFHENEPSCSMYKERQTDRHDEAFSRFSQFCDMPKKHLCVLQLYIDEGLLELRTK
jgi:hypothetical protein